MKRAIAFALVSLASVAGCAFWHSTVVPVANDVIDCAAAEANAATANDGKLIALMLQIYDLFTAPGATTDSVESALAGMALQDGKDIVACVVRDLANVATKSPAFTSSGSPSIAQAVIVTHRWKFKAPSPAKPATK